VVEKVIRMRVRRKRDPEIERLQQEIEGLKAELASSQKATDNKEEEKEKKESRDRFLQIGLEYWKAQHDFYRQLVTINLVAVGGFGAMLGGIFNDPDAWLLPLWSRLFFIIVVFACYILSATEASDASMDARINIHTMQRVETQEQFDEVMARFGGWIRPSSLSVILFLAGTTLFSLFAFFSIGQFEI
jgi:hypothetical protein